MKDMECKKCKNLIEKDFDFCPYCGVPASSRGIELDKARKLNAQLIALANLIKNIKNEESLYVIDKYIKSLTEN